MRERLSDGARFRLAIKGVALVLAVLWLIHAVMWLLGIQPTALGVRPGHNPLPGLITAPLVHGSWNHLFSNTLPLLVLGTTLFFAYPRAARIALPLIWLGSGVGVWLFAREASHIGASGIAHGLMFFVFLMGVLRRDRLSMALSLVVFFLHGGMIWGVLPQAPGVSFESHLAGSVMGVLAAVLLRRRDPLPPPPPEESEEEDEPPGPHHPDEIEERERLMDSDPFRWH